MTANTYILKWYEGSEDDRVSWFIRCIRSDGFFGEITYVSRRLQKTVAGDLSSAEYEAFHRVVDAIQQSSSTPSEPPKPGWIGMLAAGSPSNPAIIMRYYKNDEEGAAEAELFLKLVEQLRPHVERAAK
jgi:hypothetical protein